MAMSSSGSSPKVPPKRLQRGSVARSICGLRAVAMPRARYSEEAIMPILRTIPGSTVAARPSGVGQREIWPPEPALNSAVARVSLRGSELLLAGMPWPRASTKAWTRLFQRAATSGEATLVTSTARRLSSSRNLRWAAVIVSAGTPWWPL